MGSTSINKIRRPTVDLGSCSSCGVCLEVAPDILRFSESGGYLEVCDLDFYDQQAVNEAIKYCPEDSIYWEDDE